MRSRRAAWPRVLLGTWLGTLPLLSPMACTRSPVGEPPAASAASPTPSAGPSAGGLPAATPPAGRAAVRVDGRFEDWPAGTFVAADPGYLYVRLAFADERTLQAGADSVVLSITARDDGPAPRATEIRIVFSPPAPASPGGDGRGAAGVQQGVEVSVGRPAGGAETRLGHAALDLVVAPTFAAREFELRLARSPRASAAVRAALAAGTVRVRTGVRGGDGEIAWSTPARSLDLPPRAAPADGAAVPPSIPGRTPGALRVASWNVLVASPRKDPEPFARVLRALDPDVLLLQEWEGATPGELAGWLDAHVPGDVAWQASTSAGSGVAVAARGTLDALGPERVERPVSAVGDPRRGETALRLAAALVQTPLGPVCAASVHLKCCGSARSAEELVRRAEARRINEVVAAAFAARPGCLRVVGGDLNLVGSRVPLELLAAGLDSGGSALEVADTRVPGDAALYTWYQPWSRFSPGRLDYLLHAGSAARPVQAFALDTRRLPTDALAAAGLDAGDSAASDHLPIVLDLAASGVASGR